MITLNLLPDIKKEYLKSRRTKSLFVVGAFFISAGAVTLVVLIASYVLGVQTLQITSSQNSIDESKEILTETEDLAKVVTIQKQLQALPSLHEATTKVSRLFNYLKVIIPDGVSLSSVEIDFDDQTAEIKGTASDFKSINTFIDSLKNATYEYKGNTEESLAFSSVVLGSIANNDDESSFKITFEYESDIFDPNKEKLVLTVPSITSTQSQTGRPKSLFNEKEEQ